jgi:TatD DNase family protein
VFWFDSHAHLQDESFADDWREVLERAADRNILRILLPSSDLADSARAIALAVQDDRLCCSIGCHPHEASGFSAADLDQLRQMIGDHRGHPVVAIGEAGLDYHYDFSPRPVQQDVFRDQIRLAFECTGA